MARRPFSEFTPLGAGFDYDDGWMDVTDPENPIEIKFKPTWFETIPARE